MSLTGNKMRVWELAHAAKDKIRHEPPNTKFNPRELNSSSCPEFMRKFLQKSSIPGRDKASIPGD